MERLLRLAEELLDTDRVEGTNKVFLEDVLLERMPITPDVKKRLIEIYDLIIGYGVER